VITGDAVRPHWVVLIVCLILVPATALVGGLAIGIALTADMVSKRAIGASLGYWPFWTILLMAFAAGFYVCLRVLKPDKLIEKLLRR
jgi:hypothetical protein